MDIRAILVYACMMQTLYYEGAFWEGRIPASSWNKQRKYKQEKRNHTPNDLGC